MTRKRNSNPGLQYAFASQATLHGLDPHDAIIELAPRSGEFVLREEDILKVIEGINDRH